MKKRTIILKIMIIMTVKMVPMMMTTLIVTVSRVMARFEFFN